MEIQVTPGFCCSRLPCIQQETVLLHGTIVSGYCMSKFFLLPATALEGYYVFLLQVVAKNRKPHIDIFFIARPRPRPGTAIGGERQGPAGGIVFFYY